MVHNETLTVQLQKEGTMTDTNTVVYTAEKPSRLSRLNKQKLWKLAGITAGAAAGVFYLKRKLDFDGNVAADMHVETADQSDPN